MKRWKIAGAEVVGRKHLKSGLPCQDKVLCSKEGRVDIIALSDGAGSKKLSDKGASISVTVTCRVITEMFDKLFKTSNNEISKIIVSNILKYIGIESENQNVNINEFSSTLMFVAISKERYIIGHLGDGIIGKIDKGMLSVLSQADNGEYSNETFFVTSKDAVDRLRIQKGFINEESGFILMSDGSADSLYDKRNNCLSPVSSQMIEWLDTNPEDVVTKAISDNIEQFISKKTFDDCSVAIMSSPRVKEHPIAKSFRQLIRKIRIILHERF